MKDKADLPCPAKVFSDYLRLFPKTDSSWFSVRQEEPRFPLLSLPSAVFKWDEKLIYTGELTLRVLSFDPAVRREHPEIDFCIPMAYDGASERERASWGLWAGAWCDTREEFTCCSTVRPGTGWAKCSRNPSSSCTSRAGRPPPS